MILSWQLPAGIVGGAVVGLGAFLAVREVLPGTPALGPALRRLQQPVDVVVGGARRSWATALAGRLRVPSRELALLGRTPEQYVVSLVSSALLGLALPPVLAVVLALLGLGFGVVVPVVAGLVCAALFVVIAHQDVRSKAERARREFVQAVSAYLSLVALQLSAANGPVQALEQAAEICDGWVFDRIREALLRAREQLRFPWQELRDMADRIGVPELGDVGAIMQTSGTAGAQVQETLAQRAEALRDQIRTDALARAEAVTSKLDLPGAALVMVLVVYIVYPFIARV